MPILEFYKIITGVEEVIKIKNWSKHQSYKDRRPPWIRFHRSILDDYQYQMMKAESRALLPMLWLLACEDEDPTSGMIRISNDEITFRLRISNETVTESLRELEVSGFIECIESVTKPLQSRNETVTPETETETETETYCAQESFLKFWRKYPKKKDKAKSLAWWVKNVKNEELELEIIEGLNSQKKDFEQREKKFIPLPTTWLNGKRWQDEITDDFNHKKLDKYGFEIDD